MQTWGRGGSCYLCTIAQTLPSTCRRPARRIPLPHPTGEDQNMSLWAQLCVPTLRNTWIYSRSEDSQSFLQLLSFLDASQCTLCSSQGWPLFAMGTSSCYQVWSQLTGWTWSRCCNTACCRTCGCTCRDEVPGSTSGRGLCRRCLQTSTLHVSLRLCPAALDSTSCLCCTKRSEFVVSKEELPSRLVVV